MFDLTMLNPTASNILNQYKGLPEGNLKCWASHLSNHFSCVALAFYLRSDSGFWYHLSQNGEMLDEYATYAEAGWQPGQPIFSKNGGAIAGGDSRILCSALGQPDKVDEVEIILRKPNTLGENHPTKKLDYESLLNSDGFSVEKVRHWALAKALGMHLWWTVWMTYEVIVSQEEQEYSDDDEPPASWAESMAQLKSSQPTSELKRATKGSRRTENPAIAYAKKRVKKKEIEIFHPKNIIDDFREAIQALSRSSTPGAADISALLSEFVEVNLNSFPLTEPGKFSVIGDLMTVAEALTHPENLEMRRIGLSALFELKKSLHSAFLSPSGQLWLDCEPLVRSALEKDYPSSP